MIRAQNAGRRLGSRLLHRSSRRQPRNNHRGKWKCPILSPADNPDTKTLSRLRSGMKEEPPPKEPHTQDDHIDRDTREPTCLTVPQIQTRSRTKPQYDIASKEETTPTYSITTITNRPTANSPSRPTMRTAARATSEIYLAPHHKAPKLGFTSKNTNSLTSQARRKHPSNDTRSTEPLSSQIIRERQQKLLQEEARLKRKAIDEYYETGDTRVFARFLAPFIGEDEHGKRRKLGQWQWDREVERHWREDKTSGMRVWAPVEASFL